MGKLGRLLCSFFILLNATIALSHSKSGRRKAIKWNDLMADKKTRTEINHLYIEHYMRATYGILAACGNELHREASLTTRRELKRCITSISVNDKNPQKSEAKCILHAYNMLDKEKAGIQWVGAFGVRRLKRRADRTTRFSKSIYGHKNGMQSVRVIDFAKQQYMRFRSQIGEQQQRFHLKRNGKPISTTTRTTATPRSATTADSPLNGFASNQLKLANGSQLTAHRWKSMPKLAASAKINAANNSLTIPFMVEGVNRTDEYLTPKAFSTDERPSNGAVRLIDDIERETEKVAVHRMEAMPNLMGDEPSTKSPVAAMVGLAAQLFRNEDSGNTSWKETYEKVKELDYQMKTMRQVDNDNRAFDQALKRSSSFTLVKTDDEELGLVNDDKNPLKDVQGVNAIIDGMSATEKESFQFLSPKFAPLSLPDRTQKKRFLSPTFFSFYKDEDDPTNIASIPELMNGTGLKTEDRDAVVDLIMEVSGTRVQVEKTMDGLSGLADWQDIARAMIDANLRMNSTWMRLLRSMTKKQQFELDSNGFTFTEPNQLEDFVFKDDAYYKDTWRNDIPFDEYKQYDEHDRKHLLRRMVGQIAGSNETELSAAMRTWPRRMKQRVLEPFLFSGQILMPTVLGYIILSPTLFVANVLNPFVLNLELLTPRVFFPVILGPRLLAPRILGPRVLSPWVLTPFVLSPAVLDPLVLSPFILCPIVLSPGVLAPTLLGGHVLVPALLSPAIISPGYIVADILSPTLLSKKRRRKRYSRRDRP